MKSEIYIRTSLTIKASRSLSNYSLGLGQGFSTTNLETKSTRPKKFSNYSLGLGQGSSRILGNHISILRLISINSPKILPQPKLKLQSIKAHKRLYKRRVSWHVSYNREITLNLMIQQSCSEIWKYSIFSLHVE